MEEQTLVVRKRRHLSPEEKFQIFLEATMAKAKENGSVGEVLRRWGSGPILPLFVLFCFAGSTIPPLFYASACIQKAEPERLIEVRPVAGPLVEFPAPGARDGDYCWSADCLVPFVSISQGAASGIADPQEIVIESEQEWQKLWERHDPSGSAAPRVDFATQVVVGIFAGQRPTAGYQVQIVKVEREKNRIIVIYQLKSPPTDALVAQVLTQPFIIIRIPRLNLPIQFKGV